MKKLILLVGLLVALNCRADSFQDALSQTTTNLSPGVAVPSGWVYGSPPGAYFWNGFKWTFVAGFFSLAVIMVKRLIGGDREEL